MYVICEWAALMIIWKLWQSPRDAPRFTSVLCLGCGGSKSTAAWRRRRLEIARLSLAISQGIALRHLDFGQLQRPVLGMMSLRDAPQFTGVLCLGASRPFKPKFPRWRCIPHCTWRGAHPPSYAAGRVPRAYICGLYATPPALGVILMDCELVVTPV